MHRDIERFKFNGESKWRWHTMRERGPIFFRKMTKIEKIIIIKIHFFV
jgi:hypothetical protein